MNKTIIVSSILLFSALLIGCNSQANPQDASARENASTEQQEVKSEIAEVDKIEIIDFHGNRRCFSCQTIEKFAQATVEEYFQPELRDGKITFDSINVEGSENKEMVQKYQARGSSLFINVIRDGKDDITEDTNVWHLVRDEQAFKKYFKEKIENLLD